MGIYRVKKSTNYVVMNRTALNDDRLSWKAKGIIAYMLSMPDDWKFYVSEITKHAKDGEDSLRTGIKELKENGYIKRFPVKDEQTKKIIEWETHVHESPQVEKPHLEKPHLEKPYVENPTLLSIDSTKYLNKLNTDKPSTDNTSSHKYKTCDMEMAQQLFDRMLENNENAKKPNLHKWADEFRLMRERDNRTEEQIKYLIDWTQSDSFWKGNILSPTKLRKQFDQLAVRVKEEINKQGKSRKPKAYQSLQDWADES
jgi:hypothetical protein